MLFSSEFPVLRGCKGFDVLLEVEYARHDVCRVLDPFASVKATMDPLTSHLHVLDMYSDGISPVTFATDALSLFCSRDSRLLPLVVLSFPVPSSVR